MWEEQLTNIVDGLKKDIVSDCLSGTNIKTVVLKTLETGTDDGCTYGDYELDVNAGKATILLTATAVYGGFEDCWGWSNESHYTHDVVYDELQDFEYEIIGIKRFDDILDKMVDVDIDAAKESE